MELAIDSVGIISSVGISDAGKPLAEIVWPTGRRHTPTLMPMIETVVQASAIDRGSLSAIAVNTGPGSYGGIRAGMATAAALAMSLDLPAVGVGRLEIEAYSYATLAQGRAIAALHNAGREQWAVAVYRGPEHQWREEIGPSLNTQMELVDKLLAIRGGGFLCGEAADLDELSLRQLGAFDEIIDQRASWTLTGGSAKPRHATILGAIAWERLQRAKGSMELFHPSRLQPIYLRSPAIGPQ